MERLQVLSALTNSEPPASSPLIVTSAPALIQKTTPFREFVSTHHTINTGIDIEPFKLLSRWGNMGYSMENIVEVPGTISHRGGIIDIYPPTSDLPARLEFFGNTIDSIRLFDPVSQRSLRGVPSIAIGPATELLTPHLSSQPELESIVNSIDLTSCSPEVREQFQRELAMLVDRQRPGNMQFYAPFFNEDNLLRPSAQCLYADISGSCKEIENPCILYSASDDIKEGLFDLIRCGTDIKTLKCVQGSSLYFSGNDLHNKIKLFNLIES